MEDMSRYLDLFKEEAEEILQTLNDQLLALEQNPGSKRAVEELFRAAHSIKGMAATMGFDHIADLTHKMESLIDKVRKKEIEVTIPLMNILFKAADVLQMLLREVGSENPQNEINIKSIIAQLEEAFNCDFASSIQGDRKEPRSEPISSSQEDQGEISKSCKMGTVRVKLEHLDKLMDLVGELVITKARLDQLEDSHEVPELGETLDRIKAILGDLQHEVIQVRMVPVGQVFNRFPRMVRDIAQELGKEVKFVIEGTEIELDRTILDEIGDPIVHLLRNAVGHGIESPKEREQKGKAPVGTIHLIAQREKEGAVIKVRDDGKGINPNKIREIAIKNGFISKKEADALEDQEIVQLICLPGFTSEAQATSLSGRGVGVDAVKTKVGSLGGTLSVKTEPDKGAQFTMKLPPSLAIIKALLIKISGVAYAIPLKNIAEVVEVQQDELRSVNGEDVVVNHGQVIQLVQLDQVFSSSSNGESQRERFPVVVIEDDDKRKGLIVDKIMSQQDVVIKPLTTALQSVRGIGGATILGDGKVALILDAGNIFMSARRKRRINENARVD